MGSDMDMIFGLLNLGVSAYCIYGIMQMKKTGEIFGNLLLDKNTDPTKCKNTAEYISKSIPLLVMLAVGSFIFGALSIITIYHPELYWYMMASLVLCLIVIIIFGICVAKMKKKYF